MKLTIEEHAILPTDRILRPIFR